MPKVGTDLILKKNRLIHGEGSINIKAQEPTDLMITISIPWVRMVKPARPTMLKIGNKNTKAGFTLIEVMVTVAILSLGTVFISQSNLTTMNVYGRYINRIAIQNWAEEKIWETKQMILESDAPETGQHSGTIQESGRTYDWQLDVEPNDTNDVYGITLDMSWPESGKTAYLRRSAYQLKEKR